jgi:hypothetical protein
MSCRKLILLGQQNEIPVISRGSFERPARFLIGKMRANLLKTPTLTCGGLFTSHFVQQLVMQTTLAILLLTLVTRRKSKLKYCIFHNNLIL